MLPSVERSIGMEPLPPFQFCQGCIIATRGYDFREGQVRHDRAMQRLFDADKASDGA